MKHSLVEVILIAGTLILVIATIFFGNLLVIIAISREHSLKPVQNWFIASLAVADMLLGLIVVPFSLFQEVTGYWMFGYYWCQIHSALDVLLCTSSILHLCLISLDRYWSITRAVLYTNFRTPRVCSLMIIFVWFLSILISVPPLLYPPWGIPYPNTTMEAAESMTAANHTFVQIFSNASDDWLMESDVDEETSGYPVCYLSEDTGYKMYSVFGSFYIPSCIMVFVYIQIFIAARSRARRHIAIGAEEMTVRDNSLPGQKETKGRKKKGDQLKKQMSRLDVFKRNTSKIDMNAIKNTSIDMEDPPIINGSASQNEGIVNGDGGSISPQTQQNGMREEGEIRLRPENKRDKMKRKLARKKERRAILTLGIIMGTFIFCWLPFFFLYSISPVCPLCEEMTASPCCVQSWIFSFAFYLGYSNSALNPVIYTVFNQDFRKAFKKILCGGK